MCMQKIYFEIFMQNGFSETSFLVFSYVISYRHGYERISSSHNSKRRSKKFKKNELMIIIHHRCHHRQYNQKSQPSSPSSSSAVTSSSVYLLPLNYVIQQIKIMRHKHFYLSPGENVSLTSLSYVFYF